ncbi:MAG: phosphate acyltransferase PlsX [Rickettsiales bacterium]
MGKLTISIDVMGGANAPHCVLEAVNNYLAKNKNVFFRLYGDSKRLESQLTHYANINSQNAQIHHCTQIVPDSEKPKDAFKNFKDSSMYKAVEAVKTGAADACISGGNTGALLFTSHMILRTLENVKRPALVGIYPNLKGGTVFLDVGANAECDAINYFQFALMGHCLAQVWLNKKTPSIAILNVGSEETKGRDVERIAFQMLKNTGLNFFGFVEGYDLADGVVDVVVTDGFSGNLVVKTTEGSVSMVRSIIKGAFKGNYLSMLGGALAKGGFDKAFKVIDPRNYNGAMFAGLNGIVVKSHGSSDAQAFFGAITKTVGLTQSKINTKVAQLLGELHDIEATAKVSLMTKIKQKLHIGE